MTKLLTVIFCIYAGLATYPPTAQARTQAQARESNRIWTPTASHLPLSAKDNEILNKFHFVFVGGFMNELARGSYFRPLIKELRRLGIVSVSTIFPPSTTGVIETSADLSKQFYELHAKHHGKPLIIIGHSMGGLRTVAAMIAHPELVQKLIVARAIAFQSPISGSSEVRPWLDHFTQFNWGPLSGAHALTVPQVNLAIDDSIDDLNDKQFDAVSDAVRYIISSRRPEDMSFSLRRIYEMALRPQTLTDGLVDKYHMFHPELGRVILDLIADHMEFVTDDSRLSRVDRMKQKAFVHTLLKVLLLDIHGYQDDLDMRTERLRLEREAAIAEDSQDHTYCSRILGLF